MPGCHADGTARRRPHILRCRQPGIVAPAAGLWPRRPYEIETDRVEIVAGVRHSHTIGSPVAVIIRNKDWQNWTEALPVEDIDGGKISATR